MEENSIRTIEPQEDYLKKKNSVLIFFVLFFCLITIYLLWQNRKLQQRLIYLQSSVSQLSLTSRNLNIPSRTPTPISLSWARISIQDWYLIAESKNFRLYNSGALGGLIAVVVDKNTGDLHAPPSNCEMSIPEEELKKHHFFNKTVGILNHGPYKEIHPNQMEEDSFIQSYSSGGNYAHEGEIKLYLENSNIQCDIKVSYLPIEPP